MFQRVICLLLAVAIISGCQYVGIKPKKTAKQPSVGELQVLLTQADALYKTRQLDQSAMSYNQVLQVDPNNVKALYRMGNIAFRQQDLDMATSYYRKVLAVDPRHSKAQYNLAMAHLSLAEKHLKFYTATADNPTNMNMVSDIMNFLDQLSSPEQPQSQSTSLDILTDQLLGR